MAAAPARHFLSLLDYEPGELDELVARALALKAADACAAPTGRLLGLLFFNPSVRTRVSCEAAAARLGAQSVSLAPGADTWNFECAEGAVMDAASQEHVRELAPVLSRYCRWIGIRRSELVTAAPTTGTVTASYEVLARDAFLHAFARFAEVPVLNLESNRFHPLQGLADMATLRERLGETRGVKYVLSWAWHPKSLPAATPHSQLLAAAQLGMDVTLLRPEGYALDPEVTAEARRRAEAAGGSLRETDSMAEAYAGARVVCAKSWGSFDYYGRFEQEARDKQWLRTDWIVDEEKMGRTDDALFLHCLPVRRNVVVSDGVLDSSRAAHVDEAENRLWTTMAALELTASG